MNDLYTRLDIETRIVVQQRTSEIRTLMQRTAQDLVEIGQKLVEVRARLGHGLFGAWLRAEFEWSERTAQRYMSVAQAFKSDTVSVLANAEAKALYLLASPSTPEKVREEAVQRAETGERITYSTAREMVQGHRRVFSPQEQGVEDRGVRNGRSSFPVPARLEQPEPEPPLAGTVDMPLSATPGYDGDEWYTPAEYLQAAREVMGDIDLDPATCAAAQDVVQARRFFTKEDDGLAQEWAGRIWLNPPYSASLVPRLIDKVCTEYDEGRVDEALVLVNTAGSGTPQCHRYRLVPQSAGAVPGLFSAQAGAVLASGSQWWGSEARASGLLPGIKGRQVLERVLAVWCGGVGSVECPGCGKDSFRFIRKG